MARRDDLTRGASLRGILPDSLVTIVDGIWSGSNSMTLTDTDTLGRPGTRLLSRDDEPALALAASSLRLKLDTPPLWRGDHGDIRHLVEAMGRCHYLPCLLTPAVLLDAVEAGITSLTWERDTCADAESDDVAAQRYRGVRTAV